jgi:hypothetical protein
MSLVSMTYGPCIGVQHSAGGVDPVPPAGSATSRHPLMVFVNPTHLYIKGLALIDSCCWEGWEVSRRHVEAGQVGKSADASFGTESRPAQILS